MTTAVRMIGGTAFRQFRVLNPGEALYFAAGRTIAVETWALDWGQHEFDYELNSRPIDARGRPEAIATTASALQREFMERRVVSRYPVPVSVGFNGIRRLPDVALTLGEAHPQVYTSRLTHPHLAWSLSFRAHRHSGAVGGKRAAAGRVGPGAPTSPAGSGRAGGLQTDFNYLMIYLPVTDWNTARLFPRGFGVYDVIGTEPNLLQRWIARITGR